MAPAQPAAGRSPAWSAGGGLATGAVLVTMLGGPQDGLLGALLAQPAAWTVPTAFAVMVVVSLLTPSGLPGDTGRMLVRLHAPESLGLRS